MSISYILSILGYMLVCSFTPGPGNILSLNTTSKYGWKNSKKLIFGICMGYVTLQTLCTIALYFMNNNFTNVLSYIKYIGFVYMIYLAIHIIISKPEISSDNKKPSFLQGYLLQLVNVKIYFYITSLLSGYFIPNASSIYDLVIYGIIAVSIGSIASLTWAFLGLKIQIIYNKYYRIINSILGLFLIYSALLMIIN